MFFCSILNQPSISFAPDDATNAYFNSAKLKNTERLNQIDGVISMRIKQKQRFKAS
jgi:hypothetical protein